ncbi:hypothetical protein K7G98_05700 [Saccharothrix sp. MB29]|nr:hypothetical protein [Saccharothrix sp. MB29]
MKHPGTGTPCWFNQIAFLNEHTMDPAVRDYLISELGPTACRSPRRRATAHRSRRRTST